MRDALAIRAAVAIVRMGGCTAPHIEWTAKHRERCSAGVSVKRKHLLIERDLLGRRLIGRTGHRVGPTQRELLQDVTLKCSGRYGRGCHDRQGDAHPLAVEKEEQFVVDD